MATAAEQEPKETKKKRVGPMRVRVKPGRMGFYNMVRWRAGQVFQLNKPEDFSAKWMEEVAPHTRVDRPMSGNAALSKAVEVIRGGGDTNGLVTDQGSASEFQAEAIAAGRNVI